MGRTRSAHPRCFFPLLVEMAVGLVPAFISGPIPVPSPAASGCVVFPVVWHSGGCTLLPLGLQLQAVFCVQCYGSKDYRQCRGAAGNHPPEMMCHLILCVLAACKEPCISFTESGQASQRI